MKNFKVYLTAFLLTALSIGLMVARVSYGGQNIRSEFSRDLWRVDILMDIEGKGDRAKVRLTLPSDNERQTIYNENFNNDEMMFYVRQDKHANNRIGYWRAEILDKSKHLRYTFSAQLKAMTYTIPEDLTLSKDPAKDFSEDMQYWLKPSEEIQSGDAFIRKQLSKILKREKKISRAVRKMYLFVRDEVEYRSEKGNKDARETLQKMVADCGGQARLFCALSRAAGIPSRVVGGLIMEPGVKKITHVWVENYIGGQWIPFDVVNNHYAYIPADYLEIYRGDFVLIKHVLLSRFEYYFAINRENFPPVDQPWSLYALPIHFYNMVRIMLLIPVGALVVAFIRVVIGIPTLGTFTPVLLAIAFREISLGSGLLCLGIIVTFGTTLRRILDAFKILIIPRLAIVVTSVVILTLVTMLIFFHHGQREMLYVSLFPMVIMTWIIERLSVLQVEDGTVEALKSALGTMVVSICAYYLMRIEALNTYLFSFPEILLIVVAVMLLLGRYTGMRLTELFRFLEFRKTLQKK